MSCSLRWGDGDKGAVIARVDGDTVVTRVNAVVSRRSIESDQREPAGHGLLDDAAAGLGQTGKDEARL